MMNIFFLSFENVGSLHFKLRGTKWYMLCTTGALLVIVMFGNVENNVNELNYLNDKTKQQSSGGKYKNTMERTTQRTTNWKHNTMRSTNILPLDSEKLINIQEYIKLVEKKAKNRTIIISTVDYSFVEMAINLYITSFKKWDLEHYIFVCSHLKATETLIQNGIDAVQLWNDTDGTKPSDFATIAFNRKTRYKTMAATVALDMGYSVLVVDVDVVFLKDPTPYLSCNRCEIIIQSEGSEYYRNTGFYFAFPTSNTIKLHHIVLNTYKNVAMTNDQQSLNSVLIYLESHSKLKVKVLDLDKFPNGDYYFDKGQRMFVDDKPCQDCVLIHNNFIASYSNKRYRFREHLLWVIDTDQYYSKPHARYLMYENVFDFGAKYTLKMEEEALRTAFMLGHILKRIVILPRFYCYACPMDICKKKYRTPRCAAYVHYNMSTMDNVMGDKYRENMFLQNDMIPKTVKNSISPKLFIKSKTMSQQHILSHLDLKDVKKIFLPSDVELGATQEEFKNWLKPFESYSVLRFHSLYGRIISLGDVLDVNYEINLGIKSLH